MSNDLITYLLLPTTAGLIGWGTNYIAVKMIFRPRRPRRFLFFTFWGALPRRQRELAASIAQTIEQNLISHKDIQAALDNRDVEEEIEHLVKVHIDLFLKEKLGAQPIIGVFLQGRVSRVIRELLIAEFRDMIPLFMDDLFKRVEARISFREIIQRKIEAFDLSTLERIVYDISGRELRMIEYIGGVLGFAVGLAQVAVLILLRMFE